MTPINTSAHTTSATRTPQSPTVPAVGMPSPPALDPGLEALLRRMRLPHIRRAAPEVLATARAQRWDPVEVLRVLLTEEVTGRDRSALTGRW